MERPILMSTPMVKALLEGRKTQTRRTVKFKYLPEIGGAYGETVMVYGKTGQLHMPCPYGIKGDILWVRETWQQGKFIDDDGNIEYEGYVYKVGGYVFEDDYTLSDFRWRPSIFMPKEACRIRLEITDTRVEKLCNISEKDATAEGIEWGLHIILNRPRFRNYYSYPKDGGAWYHDPIDSYKSLWESINGRGSWQNNPWVWVVEFKIV